MELDNGQQKETSTVDSVNGDTVTLSSNLAQAYYEGHYLRVIEAEVTVRYAPEGASGAGREFYQPPAGKRWQPEHPDQ